MSAFASTTALRPTRDECYAGPGGLPIDASTGDPLPESEQAAMMSPIRVLHARAPFTPIAAAGSPRR